VEALMNLLVHTIVSEMDELNKNGVRMHAIGDIDNLPGNCRAELLRGMELTQNNKSVNLILALSYSARWEMVNAIREIVRSGIKEELIDSDLISAHLNTRHFPDPELLIRTSGESRISNFLLWQIAYAELYFTDTLWPDFREEDFYKAILNYQGRERRFGQTSEQISKSDMNPNNEHTGAEEKVSQS
jgi:undecaprenyl diphosphate synthase